MPAKKIIFRDEVRAKLLSGINTLAQTVRVTLGPKARTVFGLDCRTGAHNGMHGRAVAGRETTEGLA